MTVALGLAPGPCGCGINDQARMQTHQLIVNGIMVC